MGGIAIRFYETINVLKSVVVVEKSASRRQRSHIDRIASNSKITSREDVFYTAPWAEDLIYSFAESIKTQPKAIKLRFIGRCLHRYIARSAFHEQNRVIIDSNDINPLFVFFIFAEWKQKCLFDI